jgi:5-methylcytosine-specific restriction endonuclease McrA
MTVKRQGWIDLIFNRASSDRRDGTLTRGSWQRVRAIVRGRDNQICQYCGKQDPNGEVDHVLSLSRGGPDMLENLVWACQECNAQKGDKTPREWLKHLAGHGGQRDDLSDLLPTVPRPVYDDLIDL